MSIFFHHTQNSIKALEFPRFSDFSLDLALNSTESKLAATPPMTRMKPGSSTHQAHHTGWMNGWMVCANTFFIVPELSMVVSYVLYIPHVSTMYLHSSHQVPCLLALTLSKY